MKSESGRQRLQEHYWREENQNAPPPSLPVISSLSSVSFSISFSRISVRIRSWIRSCIRIRNSCSHDNFIWINARDYSLSANSA